MRSTLRVAAVSLVAALGLTAACSAPTTATSAAPGGPPPSTTTIPKPPPSGCPTFAPGVVAGTIANPAVKEASGIAASRRNPGVYWVHNDSGDTARLFATTTSGRDLGTYAIDGATALDWEDIAVGPSPAGAGSFIYIGDIGGNSGRNALRIYRVPEPTVSTTQTPVAASLPGAVAFDVVYENGGRYDAESLFVDRNGDVYVVTKSADGASRVFALPTSQQVAGVVQTMRQVASLQIPRQGSAAADGGDMTPDGGQIVIRTYDRAWLWNRAAGTSVAAALGAVPCPVALASEVQGEAVAFDANGRDLFSTSEGLTPPIHWYARR